MNPARKNKIDLDERKYFDSGDYALTKAGRTQGPVGVQHPSPDNIPHANAIAATTHNSSPVKESSLVHEAELDDKPVDSDVQPSESNNSNNTSTPSTSIPDTSDPPPE
ncbi:16066_t:CDS:2 [Racocetra fulgida]|uniref:mRNA stability protein n=1 Tax=Racocetra fulgida TaxID=60492 RepID=A0A9N8ZT20_9GLOM|nr:16066_t:CDS:2 [Racocetra fulgida]